MIYCEKCGRPFLLKQYLRTHKCESIETKNQEDEITRAELVEKARERGITGSARMKKEDLIEALNES